MFSLSWPTFSFFISRIFLSLLLYFVPSFSPFTIIQKERNIKIFHCCSFLALHFRLQVLVSFFSSSFPKGMAAQKVSNITAGLRLHSTFRLSILVSFLSSSLFVPSVHGCSEMEKRQDTTLLFFSYSLLSLVNPHFFLSSSLPSLYSLLLRVGETSRYSTVFPFLHSTFHLSVFVSFLSSSLLSSPPLTTIQKGSNIKIPHCCSFLALHLR